MCTTLYSIDHYISIHPKYDDGSNHHIYLSLDNINRENGWFSCMFSSQSKHSFEGILTIDDTVKYNDINGTLSLDNQDDSLHYSIYDAKHKEIFDFDAKGSYIDAQGLLYAYIESDYLKDFIATLEA